MGELPPALAGCATERRVCESYARALAADGGESAARLLPVQVRLRSAPGPEADPTTLAIELDAAAAGRWLGHRSLSVRARDCAALPDALALVLVLLAREAPPAQPTAAAEAPPLPPTAASPEPQRERRRAGSLELGAGAGVFLGALPTAALGLHIHASTLGELLALRVRAAFLWPQELRVEEGYVQMRHYELAIEACSGLTRRGGVRLALRLCAGPRVGLVHARAREFALRNARATELALYLGLMPEVSLALRAGTWLRLGAAGALALVRPRFGVSLDDGQGLTPLSSPGWLRAELALSLVQIF